MQRYPVGRFGDVGNQLDDHHTNCLSRINNFLKRRWRILCKYFYFYASVQISIRFVCDSLWHSGRSPSKTQQQTLRWAKLLDLDLVNQWMWNAICTLRFCLYNIYTYEIYVKYKYFLIKTVFFDVFVCISYLYFNWCLLFSWQNRTLL